MPLLSLIGLTSVFYATVLPFLALLTVGALFVPCLLRTPMANPLEIGRAIVAYLFVCIGVMLLLSGVLPLLFSLLSLQSFSREATLSLLVLSIVGIGVLAACRVSLASIDPAAQAVPRALLMTSFLLAGLLLALLGALLLLLTGLSSLGQPAGVFSPPSWWAAPLLLLATGTVLAVVFSALAKGKPLSYFIRLPLLRRKP